MTAVAAAGEKGCRQAREAHPVGEGVAAEALLAQATLTAVGVVLECAQCEVLALRRRSRVGRRRAHVREARRWEPQGAAVQLLEPRQLELVDNLRSVWGESCSGSYAWGCSLGLETQ